MIVLEALHYADRIFFFFFDHPIYVSGRPHNVNSSQDLFAYLGFFRANAILSLAITDALWLIMYYSVACRATNRAETCH